MAPNMFSGHIKQTIFKTNCSRNEHCMSPFRDTENLKYKK